MPDASTHFSFSSVLGSISASRVSVYLGRQSQQGSNPNEEVLGVTRIIIHPNYNSDTINNDISLLQLESPVSFTRYIQPVCLAAPDSTFHTGTTSWVTGWGNIGSGGGFDCWRF